MGRFLARHVLIAVVVALSVVEASNATDNRPLRGAEEKIPEKHDASLVDSSNRGHDEHEVEEIPRRLSERTDECKISDSAGTLTVVLDPYKLKAGRFQLWTGRVPRYRGFGS